MENFRPPQNREHAGNGNDSDGSGEEDHKTPKEEKMDLDEPGSGGRVTRGTVNQVCCREISIIDNIARTTTGPPTAPTLSARHLFFTPNTTHPY